MAYIPPYDVHSVVRMVNLVREIDMVEMFSPAVLSSAWAVLLAQRHGCGQALSSKHSPHFKSFEAVNGRHLLKRYRIWQAGCASAAVCEPVSARRLVLMRM